jgi:DNA-binding response OmpR family regulator
MRPTVTLMSAKGKKGKGKILVIDDSEIVLDAAQAALEEAGFEVATLSTPFELAAVVAREKPDLILLDVMMPLVGGETVHEILKRREALKGIPVLFHSDRPESELQALVERTGALGYIPKVGDTDRFVAEVQRWARHLRTSKTP